MTRVLNSIDAATAQRIRDAISGKPQLREAMPRRTPRTLSGGWRHDPVIAPAVERFPDGRLGLWLPVRLRTPQEAALKGRWREGHKWNKHVASIVGPYLEQRVPGLKPNAIEEVWCVQVAPHHFFDGDNLGTACKHIRDLLCRHIGRDDASWKKGAIRWRYMWTKHAAYGCLMLIHGRSENGRYDRVRDGEVFIERADGTHLVINARDELRDTP